MYFGEASATAAARPRLGAMADELDVIVIGAGPAGENAAGRCADGGLSVAIVEAELVGGECSYWGCIPSKTLIRPGDVLAAARRVPGAAEAIRGGLDAAAAFAQRDYMTSSWSDAGQLKWLESEGVELVRGRGRLTGTMTVTATTEGATRDLSARRAVVIATGTSAAVPPIEGLREIAAWDNRGATAARQVPRRLLVLGGGAIGVEMAQAFRRLGCEEVTVVEALDRLLANEEPFAGDELRRALEDEGIAVVTGTKLVAARRDAGGAVLATLEDGSSVETDEMLVAVGRRPNTADIGLDAVGLSDRAGRYLDVDDRFRVRGVEGEWLYAVGDCNGRALLTHMGKYQARLCADVILGRDAVDVADHGIVPRVTFTDPQVCAVGLTERQARDQGLNVRAVSYGTGDVAGASTLGNGVSGTSQLVVDDDRRVIVGATFTGPGIQELLHSATIAIAGEVTLDRLWHAVPAFPTVSEVWLRLLEAYGL
jgi:pyruvate/2-oxoglutarate dehydrogenase complex dihydrolipoamide dehydrogenase (E3) component